MKPPNDRAAITRIGVAVVESDGHFLVGIRSADRPLPGQAEFPGGKCQPDETPRACAVRECREETGLIVTPRTHLQTVKHRYDHGTLELSFWHCGLNPDLPPCATAMNGFFWVKAAELQQLDFPDANHEVIQRLQNARE